MCIFRLGSVLLKLNVSSEKSPEDKEEEEEKEKKDFLGMNLFAKDIGTRLTFGEMQIYISLKLDQTTNNSQ